MQNRKKTKTKIQNTTVLAFLLALVPGCATQTRLGDIIPSHPLSDQGKDEAVLINIVKIGGDRKAPTPGGQQAMGGPIPALAAGLAVDFIKSELEKEADRYEAQFSKKAWLTTDDIGTEGTHIILSRWVQPKSLTFGDSSASYFKPDKNEGANKWNAVLPEYIRARTLQATLKRELAFLFIMEIKPASTNGPGPFTIRPAYLWSWKSKAKIVDFRLNNGWRPWTMIGTLLFKTDSTVSYRVDLTLESLVKLKDTPVPVMVKNGPTDPLISNLSHRLGNTGIREFEDRVGGWFDVPAYSTNIGYFTVDLKVTERDASNVRKKLLKGSESLEKNKDSIISNLTGN